MLSYCSQNVGGKTIADNIDDADAPAVASTQRPPRRMVAMPCAATVAGDLVVDIEVTIRLIADGVWLGAEMNECGLRCAAWEYRL